MGPKKAIDIRELLSGVEFNPDDVVRAASVNSVMYVDAIEFRLQCMERKANAKLNHERIEAETSLRVRKRYKDLGEKVTEGNVDALVLLDPKVAKAANELAQAESYDEYSKLICDVFKMRRDCLKIVDEMTRDEIRQQSALEAGAEKMREQRQALRAKFPGRGV